MQLADHTDDVHASVHGRFVRSVSGLAGLLCDRTILTVGRDVDFVWFLFNRFLSSDFVHCWFFIIPYLSKGVIGRELEELLVSTVGLAAPVRRGTTI